MTDMVRSEIKKFLTFPTITEQIGAQPKFGRLILQDERSKEHPLKEVNRRKAKLTTRPRKARKWRSRWQGNQGSSSMCTAFSFLHFFEHYPIIHSRSRGKYKNLPYPAIDPRILYCEAQALDPWPGGCTQILNKIPSLNGPAKVEFGEFKSDYDGTSVLAMMKVAQRREFISSYHWEFQDLDAILNTILNVGPVIVGTNWYRDMELKQGDANTQEALLLPTGGVVSGHAYLIDEANLTRKAKGREIGIFNSWGNDWAWSGRAYMSLDTLEKLIKEDGEVVFPEEIP